MKSERISLSPSGWTYFYGGSVRARFAGLLPFPLCILGLFLDLSWLVLSGVVLSGVAYLLALRGERDAFFTLVRVHRRPGLLGLVVEDIPIHEVEEVLVDPLPHFPEMGNMTVQCRSKRLRFERVPDAEAKARRILEFAKVARERGQGDSRMAVTPDGFVTRGGGFP